MFWVSFEFWKLEFNNRGTLHVSPRSHFLEGGVEKEMQNSGSVGLQSSGSHLQR